MMVGVTQIEIEESAEKLELLISKESNPRVKERLPGLYLIKKQGISISEIAKILGKNRSTVPRWLKEYREEGRGKMVKVGSSSGRTRVIPKWAIESLKKQLKEPERGFASYKEIQQWLAKVLGIEVKYATVHNLVRYQLKAKLKVPRPRNQKQDQAKREAFKKTSD